MSARATHRDPIAQRGFTQLENAVLFDGSLTVGARLMYAALKHYAWRGDGEIPAQAEVADALGVSERALKTYASELREKNLVTMARRLGRPSIYVIEAPKPLDSHLGNICPTEGADIAPPNGQDLPEKGSKEVDLTNQDNEENPKGFSSVVEAWLRLAPPLIKHRESVIRRDTKTKRAIEKAVATYELPDVISAVRAYATVLASSEHVLDYKWSMHEFFTRTNALPKFLPEALPLENYLRREAPKRDRGVSALHILQMGAISDQSALPASDLDSAA